MGEKINQRVLHGELNKFNFGIIQEVPVLDELKMTEKCAEIVSKYYNSGIDLKYQEAGLMERAEIVQGLFSNIKGAMEIKTKLKFEILPEMEYGSYQSFFDKITLNAKFLENTDFKELTDTILHEARHAFQHKAINNPESVSTDKDIIKEWKYNFDYYIDPEYDFISYYSQPVEADANNFASSILLFTNDANNNIRA